MSVLYRKFARHVINLTSNAKVIGNKSYLKGIKHYEDGSVVVSDSHRLYLVKDISDKGDCLITPGGIVMQEEYPDVSRLIPNNLKGSVRLSTEKWIKSVELLSVAAKIANYDKLANQNYPLIWEESIISFTDYNVSALVEIGDGAPGPVKLNTYYLLHALKLFELFRYDKFEFQYHEPNRPYVLSSLDDRVTVLIMPIRG